MAKVYLKKSMRIKWGCISRKGERCYFSYGENKCAAPRDEKYNCGGYKGHVYIKVPAPEEKVNV